MATEIRTKRIDADTHFNLSVDYKDLNDLLPRARNAELQNMMWLDAERMLDPDGVRARLPGAGERPDDRGGDPDWDPEARIEEMGRLGFDMQVLNTQRAMPAPLHQPDYSH